MGLSQAQLRRDGVSRRGREGRPRVCPEVVGGLRASHGVADAPDVQPRGRRRVRQSLARHRTSLRIPGAQAWLASAILHVSVRCGAPHPGPVWPRPVHWRGARWASGPVSPPPRSGATCGSGSVAFAQLLPFALRVDVLWPTVTIRQVRVAILGTRCRPGRAIVRRGSGASTLVRGGVSERPKEHASKACVGASPPRVRIPAPPPVTSGDVPRFRPDEHRRFVVCRAILRPRVSTDP